jgi:CBS domain-containing protein
MKVRDAMTAQVVTAKPSDTVQQVARIMSEVDTGAVPVVEGDTVVGLVTDRDLVLRVVAEGGSLDTPVSRVMTEGVQSCAEDDALSDAAKHMADLQMRRLVVLGKSGKLAGILSLGDIATEFRSKAVGKALEEISERGDEPA